jgi:cholesterol transport system auxiliary component
MKTASLALTLCVALSSTGCGGLLPKPAPPPARYTLDTSPATVTRPAVTRPARADGPILLVALPTSAPGHDSARMVYLMQAQALQAYAFHEWVDTPARMLAPLLVRALQDGGAFRAVLLSASSARGGLRLETEVLRLQQDFGSRPSRVRLTLRAVLVDSATRAPLAWREFDASLAAASDDAPGGAAAAAELTRQTLAAMADFAATAAAATSSRREP